MRNKLLLTAFSVIAILAVAVSPVYAITGDFVKDNEHPYVGLVVFYDENGSGRWRLSPTSETEFQNINARLLVH